MSTSRVILFILGISVLLTAFYPAQHDFSWIICFYSLGFGSYAVMIKRMKNYSSRSLMLTFLFVSLTLLFAFPQLSDDVYRFYWDAMLSTQGISPYAFLPTEIVEDNILNSGQIYSSLNSKEYYSIYPPLNQVLFAIAYWFSDSIISFSVGLKILYLAIVLIGWKYTLEVLKLLGLDSRLTYLFYLNPLVLVEGLGNLHVELVMVSLMAMAIYMYQKKGKPITFAVFYSGAIGLKINPLLISPFLWFNQPHKWKWKVAIITLLLTLLLMLPIFLWSSQTGFLSSIDLYFRKFEFNGSIYYLMRYLGKLYVGYNLIAQLGPILAIIVITAILWKSIKAKDRNTIGILNLSLWAWTLYLLCSTTIHPWYIIPLIYFSLFNGKIYPVMWSYLITWTYINYSYQPYWENLWVVTLEYIILGIIILYESNHLSFIKERLTQGLRKF